MRLRGGGLGSSDEDSVSNVINVRSEEAMSEGGRHDDETDEGRSGMEGDKSSDSFEPVQDLQRSQESISDYESSSGRAEIHTNDKEGLQYGSEDSDLSNWLAEELERVDEVEEMELSLPARGWTDYKDEVHAVGSNYEEGEDQKLDMTPPRHELPPEPLADESSSDDESSSTGAEFYTGDALSEGGHHKDETEDGQRGREGENSFDEFVPLQDLKRPRGWLAWEEKTRQRPAPLQPPRIQTLEYCNMTIRAAEDEEGIQVMSQYKDKYMRSEVQLQRISDAQGDQRKVAGGVYRCLERDQEGFELVIHKGYKTKMLGIVLRRRQEGRPTSLFESFGDMQYEYFQFCKFTDGLRWRQECPDRTPTGYIWTGVGGEMPMPDRATGDVFVFCERVDRDLHFSEGPCERLTQAPGASQSVCSNASCGLVKWHLARKCFRRVSDGQFVELWQDDFALVVFRSGSEKLLWTHPNRRLKKSWWERLEDSPQYDAFVPDAGSRKRVHENFPKLPPWHFHPPSYVPHHQSWSDPEPLEREADDSSWYNFCFLANCKPKLISNWTIVILIFLFDICTKITNSTKFLQHNQMCSTSNLLIHLFVRKFLASVLQGLCLTPGRRLQPTLEKLERCAGETNVLGNTAKALLALVQRKSNSSLEDFAVAIGATRDDDDKMRTNADLLLKLLTTELANSGEWKLMEMANRHELKFVFHNKLSCGHSYNDRVVNQYSDIIEFTVPLDTSATSSNQAITEAELQRIMDGYNRQTMQVECRRCKKTVQLACSMEVPHACDPDFLTLVCKPVVNIRARRLRLQFSQSSYVVKAVSQWQKERKMGSVTRQKSDGSWWFHGVVTGQAANHQYTDVQLESGMHFRNVAVLYAVREGVGEEENDADWTDMVMIL